MTIDDENSVYVGGIPYDATEESISGVFDLYGKIVAVKIVNDRDIGGKCYAFVTYTNPQSAIDAIAEMDGASIDGRIVRVNEVKTRGGKPNFNREGFRRGMGRGMDWDRGRIRERDQHHSRGKYWDRDTDHDRGYSRSRGYRQDSERGLHDQDHFSDQDREHFRSVDGYEKNHHQNRGEGNNHHFNKNQDGEFDGTKRNGNESDNHKDQPLKKRNRSSYSCGNSREQVSESSGDLEKVNDMAEEFNRSIRRRDELQNEISMMENKLKERQQLSHDLQRKSQKIEDSLSAKKKLVTQRKTQLTKLHKCFMQVQEYNEKLKISENDLQNLIDSATAKVDNDKDVLRDADGLISLSA